MKSKITIPIIFFLIITCSLVVAFNINHLPPNLPLAVFSIACTILLASLALPSLLGISDSKIVKGLFFILYNNSIHIFFPVYQVILAVVALIAEYSSAVCNVSILISRFFLVLIIFDLFYILFYLRYLINAIGSPGQMLQIFGKSILRKIRKTKDGHEADIFSEIQMLVKISKDTNTGEEKSAALRIFENLLIEVTKYYPVKEDIVPTEFQYRLWKSLVGNIYEVCHSDTDIYSANDRNLSEAIEILNKAWKLISHWSESGFDYAICTRELRKLANFAVKKGYNKSINRAAAVIGKMGEECLSAKSHPRAAPFEFASVIAELGISVVKAGKDDLTDQFIIHLLNFYAISRDSKYLFYTLKLMSFIWDNIRDALEDLSEKLDGMEKSECDEAVKYGLVCHKRETVRIRRFLDAVRNSSAPLS